MDMIGIYDTNPVHPGLAGRLRKALCDYETPVEVFEIALPSFGARNTLHAFLNPEPQPFVSGDQRFYAFAEGELYSTPTGNIRLSYLMEHFLCRGLSGWEQVNGQFVLVVYDRERERLHLINDRFGLRRFYYTWEGGRLIFGSQIKRVLAVREESADFSLTGIAELMLFGHHFGEGTLFEGIHSLPPASILTVEGSGLKSERYWKALYTPDRKVSARGLGDHMRAAIERQLPGGGRKGLLLSGGLDSRCIISEAYKQDSMIAAFTFGERDSRDVRYAAQICSTLGIEHHVLEFDPQQWKATIPQVVWHTEGEASFHHYKSMQFHPFIKHYCDTILTGVAVEVVVGLPGDKKLLRKMPVEILADHAYQQFPEHSLTSLQQVLHPGYYEEMMRSVREVIVSTLSENENEIAADILDAWNIENQQRRFLCMGPASDRYIFNIRAPFIDNDLIDYGLTIPAELRHRRHIYRKALWLMMPELRHIPRQLTGLPPFPDRMTALRWRMTHPSHLFRGRRSHEREFCVSMADLLRQGFTREELQSLVCRSGQRWHQFFNMHQVESVIEDHFSQKADHSTLMAKFLTLCFAEKLFLEKDTASLFTKR